MENRANEFSEWNQLLLEEYFSPAFSGEEVWIRASREELDSFGIHLGGAEGLIEAVRGGPPWREIGQANCAEVALQLARQRQSRPRVVGYVDPGSLSDAYRGKNAPTYMPIVALWVLASSESAEEGFYATVGKLLDQSFPTGPQSTRRMEEVWNDLARWSSEECKEQLGFFQPRVLGGHRYVGIPRSQCLVSRHDQRSLPRLFLAAGLRPGQKLGEGVVSRIGEFARDAYYLSRGLKAAFADATYSDPLRHLLQQALDQWDGNCPSPRSNASGVGSSNRGTGQPQGEELEETTLVLAPSATEVDAWDIGWRFRAPGVGGTTMFVVGEERFLACREPWGETYVTEAGVGAQERFREILASTGTQDVQHKILNEDNEAGQDEARNALIARRPVRVLVWDAPDPQQSERLVEHRIPANGPAYIVCSASNRRKFERILEKEEIDHQAMTPAGLPAGWCLVCLPAVERLTREQRRLISDEDDQAQDLVRARFVGGQRVFRSGAQQYAWYDLPTLEVEAPPGAVVEGHGLELSERSGGPSNERLSPIRRFDLAVSDDVRSSFSIRISNPEGVELKTTRLKLTLKEGTGAGSARDFSLGPLGRSAYAGGGLRGMQLGGKQAVPSVRGADPVAMPLARCDLPTAVETHPGETAAGKFLDSLRHNGSLGFGVARDQLARLGASQRESIDPVLALLDLRATGHLEIEVDQKGHLVRVHQVDPALYRLPAQAGGLQVFGVSGSLRYQQWEDLLQEVQGKGMLLDPRMPGFLPALRIATGEPHAAEIAERHGFQLLPMACTRIAAWAGQMDQARRELSHWGWTSFSADLRHLRRLDPNSAAFVAGDDGSIAVDAARGCQLFRFDDPNVPGLPVHLLGVIVPEDGRRSYSFIHDSRWGVWMAELAFARMMRERYGRDDAYPWPIHYDGEVRDFWIPARMKPPLVLERALVACSGAGPDVVLASGVDDKDRIRLSERASGKLIGWVSQVYAGLKDGNWLRYRWVPSTVAEDVATALDGGLHAIWDGQLA